MPPPQKNCAATKATVKPAKFLVNNYVIREDGCLVFFDFRSFRQVGPEIVPGIYNVKAIAGSFHPEVASDRIALNEKGAVFIIPHGCAHAQINQWIECHVAPARRVNGLPKIEYVSSYNGAHLVIDGAGKVWGWGWNAAGQIGRMGGREPYQIQKPTRLPLPIAMKSVWVDRDFSTALDIEGNIWFWGAAPWEGENKYPDNFIPKGKIYQTSNFQAIKLDGLPPAKQVKGRTILAQDGSVWHWGENYYNASDGGIKKLDAYAPFLLIKSSMVERIDGNCVSGDKYCILVLSDERRFLVDFSRILNDSPEVFESIAISKSSDTCFRAVSKSDETVFRDFCFEISLIPSKIKNSRVLSQLSDDCKLLSSGQIFCGSQEIP